MAEGRPGEVRPGTEARSGAGWGLGRTITTSFRMTEEEAALIRRRAEGEGLTSSELLRRLALVPGWRPLGGEATLQLLGLKNQLRLVGSNLNQLTRQAHLVGLGDRPAAGLGADLAAAVQDVRRVAEAIGAVLAGLPGGGSGGGEGGGGEGGAGQEGAPAGRGPGRSGPAVGGLR